MTESSSSSSHHDHYDIGLPQVHTTSTRTNNIRKKRDAAKRLQTQNRFVLVVIVLTVMVILSWIEPIAKLFVIEGDAASSARNRTRSSSLHQEEGRWDLLEEFNNDDNNDNDNDDVDLIKCNNNSPQTTQMNPERMAAIRQEQQEACNHFPWSIDAFIKDVHEATEEKGNRRWVFQPGHGNGSGNGGGEVEGDNHNGTTRGEDKRENITSSTALQSESESASQSQSAWIFPEFNMDLLDSAFAHRRIAIVGDSTTFYLMRWIHHLMHIIPAGYVQAFGRYNVTRAHRKAEEYMAKVRPDKPVGIEDVTEFFYNRNQAHFLWQGFNGANIVHNCDFDNLVWPSVQDFAPEILIVNWGIHALLNPHLKVCNIYQFLHLETIFYERILEIAQHSKTKLILFKTTNLMCESSKVTTLDDNGCHEFMPQWAANPVSRQQLEAYNISTADLNRWCDEATFNERGAERLNARLRAFVDEVQERPGILDSNITLAIYNDHDMESCPYTQWNDGYHHQLLAFPRIRLLSHMIHCLWKDD